MAGETSKKLAHKVRDILDDLSKKRVRNDTIIYDLLSRYQREWMSQLNTTPATLTITLTTDTEYNLEHDTMAVNKVIRFRVPEEQTTDYYIKYDKINNKIILSEEVPPVTDEIIYADCYMKPSEEINGTTDPVIGSDFEPYLIDAVLTHFPTKDIPQTLENIENVRERVRRQANSTKNKDRQKPGKIFQLNYY